MKNCCKTPFERITIGLNGDVSLCCPAFNNYYYIGNIFTESVEEIYYGKKAIEFRKSVLDKTYKYCNLDICGEYKDWNFFNEDKDNLLLKPEYPEIVNLQYSTCCNVRCITCRDSIYIEDKKETDKFNQIIDKIVLLCKNCKFVKINGGGELFISPHSKKLLQKLTSTYPNLKFIIHTNGLLCDEKHIKDFGLDGKIEYFMISVHAATKKTYESIVRGGHWEQLLKNLEYIKSLKVKKELDFVLHSLNYKEMPAFVKMANKFGAVANFWTMYNWDTSYMCKNIDMYSCWKPYHPEYKNFLKILNKLKRMKKYNYKLSENRLVDLQAQTVNPWWVRFCKIFRH